MAADNLTISRTYADGKLWTEAQADSQNDSIETWATSTVNNLLQIATDAFGPTYVLDNDGIANLATPLIDLMANLSENETVTGDWTFSGATTFSGTITATGAITSSNTVVISNDLTVDSSGVTILNSDFKVDGNGLLEFAGANNTGWISNIGFTYSGVSGEFKITDAGGTDLAAANPGFMTLPSTTKGQVVSIKLTAATHLFVDDIGASDIIGMEFGVTTGVAWGSARPFFLYAVNSDNSTSGLAFGISPDPTLTTSPVGTGIGYHSVPSADNTDSDMFFLTASNVTATHASKPCVLIGSFAMTMSAADDWTVSALSNGDRIGGFQEGVEFDMPLAQMGAATGTFFKTNGGTAPVQSSNLYKYQVSRGGLISLNIDISGDGGADGAGAVTAQVATPYVSSRGSYGAGMLNYNAGLNDEIVGFNLTAAASDFKMEISLTGALTTILNSDFPAGGRTLDGTLTYKAF